MKRILAIDYGDTNIGLAIGDTEMKIASPYLIIKNAGEKNLFMMIAKILAEEDFNTILIGLPVSLSGEVNEQLEKISKFIIALEKEFSDLDIIKYDERFSSKEAEKKLIGKSGLKDDVAAQIILQAYLDSLS